MREILFRGKRADNGEWVEGFTVRQPSAVQIGESSPWYISVPPIDPDDNGGYYNVLAETVGQYTGLTDKNGKKIFEGDIVLLDFSDGIPETGDIVWSRTGARFKFNSPDGTKYGIDVTDVFEVIGNIHDNPELLKGGEE